MIRKLLLGLMIASVASLAWAGIPDAGQSEVWVGEYPGVDNCGVRFAIDGTGDVLENGWLRPSAPQPPGTPVQRDDCTIWVQVRNSEGNPIPLTAGDVWLEWGGTILLCNDGPDYALAMSQSTFPGLFYWEGTRAAGGYGNSHTVFVLGTELTARAEIMINSQDITGNVVAPGTPSYLKVEGADSVLLYQSWGTNYHYRADFNFDHYVSGPDAVLFFQAWGKDCP